MKALYIIFGIFILALFILTYMGRYDNGWLDGYNKGYKNGLSDSQMVDSIEVSFKTDEGNDTTMVIGQPFTKFIIIGKKP